MAIDLYAISALLSVILYLIFRNSKRANLPPSPPSLPVVGHVPFLTMKPHKQLARWANQYGSVLMLKLAKFRMVVISDPAIARQAYSDPALLGRPDFPIIDVYCEGQNGLFGSQGETWTVIRTFTLRQLHEMGFGKSKIHDMYLKEVSDFIQDLRKLNGKSVCLNRKFSLAAINALWILLTGVRLRHDDPELSNILSTQTRVFQGLSRSPLCLFFPTLAKMIPEYSGWKAWETGINNFKQAMAKPVDGHMTDFVPERESRDFIDTFLQQIHRASDKQSPFYDGQGKIHLKNLIGELFGAGCETTAQTLAFGILYLATYRDKQTKLQTELDTVTVGQEFVKLSDRKKMPYCQAVILETLRRSTITPFGIFHAAIETTTLAGYNIPKGTWICVNQDFLHHNPEVWENPQEFTPERFLSTDGTSVHTGHEWFIPFSTGKRSCPGESLAKDGVFLFLANMFKHFDVKLDPAHPVPSAEGSTGLFRFCDFYNVIVSER